MGQPWQQQLYSAQQDAFHARQQCNQLTTLIAQQNNILSRLAKSVETLCASVARSNFVNARKDSNRNIGKPQKARPQQPHRHTAEEFAECEQLLQAKLSEIIDAREMLLNLPEVASDPNGQDHCDFEQLKIDKDVIVKETMELMREYDDIPDRPADVPFMGAIHLVEKYNKCGLMKYNKAGYSSLPEAVVQAHLHKVVRFSEHGHIQAAQDMLYVHPGPFRVKGIAWSHPANKARNGQAEAYRIPTKTLV